MSIFSSVGRIVTRYSAARARHQAELVFRSLPMELRKDIGWPESVGEANGRLSGRAIRVATR